MAGIICLKAEGVEKKNTRQSRNDIDSDCLIMGHTPSSIRRYIQHVAVQYKRIDLSHEVFVDLFLRTTLTAGDVVSV